MTFYSQSDAPERYRARDDVDFEDAMYVFDDGEAYRGYWAFRELPGSSACSPRSSG